jgi:NAD(P)-dependent dehydrogenase (short-subunit alcohol dehydrogenase family)
MPADDTYLWVGPAVNSWQQGEALTKMKKDLARPSMGRMGSPDETAKAVSFLGSDDTSYSYISGIEPFVDGGVAQI